MPELSIPVILGTARRGRRSESIALHVAEVIGQRGLATQLVDVADYAITGTGHLSAAKSLETFGETIASADGIVIVAPEYNHGYPGELKLLLDSQGQAYARKPVGFVSVSSGLLGGARMVEQLRLVATALRMVPVSPAVHVSEVTDALDDQGRFRSVSLRAVLDSMLDEVDWFARTLALTRTTSS